MIKHHYELEDFPEEQGYSSQQSLLDLTYLTDDELLAVLGFAITEDEERSVREELARRVSE